MSRAISRPIKSLSIGESFARVADTLVLAIVVVLPWSISAATILAVCWIAALLLSPYVRHVGEELKTLAGGLPVALWALAILGTLWSSDVSWPDRIRGLDDFHRLWAIPFLFAQFRISPYGRVVLIGFVASCVALLATSYLMYFVPALSWRWARSPGVPVKDYVAQSGQFVICAFGLLAVAFDQATRKRYGIALALTALAAAFLLNLAYVATGRTAIVTILALLLWLGMRNPNWRNGALIVAAGLALLGTAWITSSHLQSRLVPILQEVQSYRPDQKTEASAAVRMEFWRRSLIIVENAPLIGHGIGSIQNQFEKTAVGSKELSSLVTRNPHNQLLLVAIQLGAIGALLLCAMWAAHLWLFRAPGTIALFGSLVVVQGVVSCMFNSHLSDFTQGSLYVIGVGTLGGMLKRTLPTTPPQSDALV